MMFQKWGKNDKLDRLIEQIIYYNSVDSLKIESLHHFKLMAVYTLTSNELEFHLYVSLHVE